MTANGSKVSNRFRFATGPVDAAYTAPPWTQLSWRNVRVTSRQLQSFATPGDPPAPWARDLFTLVTAAYVADRHAQYPDKTFWQREIHLDIPVADPDPWMGQATATLESLLGYLSGDVWHLQIRPGISFTPFTQLSIRGDWRAEQVALFSGGIDSTAAASAIAAKPGDPLLLVSYHRGKTKQVQEDVLAAVRRHARRVVHHAPLDSALSAGDKKRKQAMNDSEHRTRGLRFIGTGVYLAAAHGVKTLTVPENGQLAVNPPLSLSRAGAWSTRSVHPWVIALANKLIEQVGGDVRIENPLLTKTKGQVSRLALESGLTETELLLTNSCSTPNLNMGDGMMHCGGCFACLVRRSGLQAAGVEDTTPYQQSFSDAPLDTTLEENTRALDLWLRRGFSRLDLTVDLPLPDTAADLLLPVIETGRIELRAMLDTQHSTTLSRPPLLAPRSRSDLPGGR